MGDLPLFIVDAFTDRAFGGNPAAICLYSGPPLETAWCQAIAAEMNLSETAFVSDCANTSSNSPDTREFGLRWFTPQTEVDLCGHATLAAAHILLQEGLATRNQLMIFHSRSGPLLVRLQADGLELDFPRLDVCPAPVPPELGAALGVEPVFVGRSAHDLLVEVATSSQVKHLSPDLEKLRHINTRGIIVTAPAQYAPNDCPIGVEAHHFVSRFFAPAVGIPEDPVTGSAHCCLGPYWGAKLGRIELVGHQLSARGGRVLVRVADQRVYLTGQAVTVLRGTLCASTLVRST